MDDLAEARRDKAMRDDPDARYLYESANASDLIALLSRSRIKARDAYVKAQRLPVPERHHRKIFQLADEIRRYLDVIDGAVRSGGIDAVEQFVNHD